MAGAHALAVIVAPGVRSLLPIRAQLLHKIVIRCGG